MNKFSSNAEIKLPSFRARVGGHPYVSPGFFVGKGKNMATLRDLSAKVIESISMLRNGFTFCFHYNSMVKYL